MGGEEEREERKREKEEKREKRRGKEKQLLSKEKKNYLFNEDK